MYSNRDIRHCLKVSLYLRLDARFAKICLIFWSCPRVGSTNVALHGITLSILYRSKSRQNYLNVVDTKYILVEFRHK